MFLFLYDLVSVQLFYITWYLAYCTTKETELSDVFIYTAVNLYINIGRNDMFIHLNLLIQNRVNISIFLVFVSKCFDCYF